MTTRYRSVYADGTLAPLVVVRLWDAEDAQLAALFELLGPDRPVYVLEPPDRSEVVAYRTMDRWCDYARRCLEQLPTGPPYRLAGWSFGGLVALELARRLEHDGVEVQRLELIDVWQPVPRRPPDKVVRHVRQLIHLPAAERLPYLSKVVGRAPRATYRSIRDRTRRARDRRHGTPSRATSENPAQLAATTVAFHRYRAHPYGGAVTLYAAEATIAANLDDPTLGWSPWMTGGLRVVPLPGTHYTIWRQPLLPNLAAAMAEMGAARSDQSAAG